MIEDERLVKRIESFSDLIIGFSIALLALTLVIPAHAADLFSNWFWLIAYAWTFAVITSIWYDHQRLFAHYFVPTPLNVILNFFLLSTLGIIVYFVQVFAHARGSEDQFIALMSYFVVVGLPLLLLGVLYLHGVRARWDHLRPNLRFRGLAQGLRNTIIGASFEVSAITIALLDPSHSMTSLMWFPLGIAVAGVALRVALMRIKPKVLVQDVA